MFSSYQIAPFILRTGAGGEGSLPGSEKCFEKWSEMTTEVDWTRPGGGLVWSCVSRLCCNTSIKHQHNPAVFRRDGPGQAGPHNGYLTGDQSSPAVISPVLPVLTRFSTSIYNICVTLTRVIFIILTGGTPGVTESPRGDGKISVCVQNTRSDLSAFMQPAPDSSKIPPWQRLL